MPLPKPLGRLLKTVKKTYWTGFSYLKNKEKKYKVKILRGLSV